MVRWPWRSEEHEDGIEGGADDSGDAEPSERPGGIDVEPLVDCELQDGTLFVYEDHVYVERDGRSRFESKTVPMDRIRGVEYDKGITIGYIQIEEIGFDHDTAGLLSDPIDANTLHFQRNRRGCAREARDEILARCGGGSGTA